MDKNISKNTVDISKNTDDIAKISEDVAFIKDNAGLCVDDHIYPTGEYCGEWAGATLKKVPLFGYEDYNIEWPTEEMWADISPDTKLESIELSF